MPQIPKQIVEVILTANAFFFLLKACGKGAVGGTFHTCCPAAHRHTRGLILCASDGIWNMLFSTCSHTSRWVRSYFGSSHFGSRFAFAGTERFHPLVGPPCLMALRRVLETGKCMCPPSLNCTGDMVVLSSFVPRRIAMARFVPTMWFGRMRMGGPSPAPSAAVRLQSHGYCLTMVHWSDHSARSLVGAKRLQRSPRQRGSVSWRRKSRICSSSWPSQPRQQDKAKLRPLWSTTLRWKILRPIWRGPTLWIRGDRTSLLAASRGTLRLCSSNSTQQLGSWKGAKQPRNAWQLPSTVRLSASKQKKPQLTWLRVPNSLWSTKEAQEAQQAPRVAQDELAKATAEVGALAAQRASGAVRTAALHRRRLPRMMRQTSLSLRVWTILRTTIPLGRSWTRASGRHGRKAQDHHPQTFG